MENDFIVNCLFSDCSLISLYHYYFSLLRYCFVCFKIFQTLWDLMIKNNILHSLPFFLTFDSPPTHRSHLLMPESACWQAADGPNQTSSFQWRGGRSLAVWLATGGEHWPPRAGSCWWRCRVDVGFWCERPGCLWPTRGSGFWSSRCRPIHRGRCRIPAHSGSCRSDRGSTGCEPDWEPWRGGMKRWKEKDRKLQNNLN